MSVWWVTWKETDHWTALSSSSLSSWFGHLYAPEHKMLPILLRACGTIATSFTDFHPLLRAAVTSPQTCGTGLLSARVSVARVKYLRLCSLLRKQACLGQCWELKCSPAWFLWKVPWLCHIMWVASLWGSTFHWERSHGEWDMKSEQEVEDSSNLWWASLQGCHYLSASPWWGPNFQPRRLWRTLKSHPNPDLTFLTLSLT